MSPSNLLIKAFCRHCPIHLTIIVYKWEEGEMFANFQFDK